MLLDPEGDAAGRAGLRTNYVWKLRTRILQNHRCTYRIYLHNFAESAVRREKCFSFGHVARGFPPISLELVDVTVS